MNSPFIKAVGLTKKFLKGSQEIIPVNELSFEVEKSEFISLMMMIVPLITLLMWRHYELSSFIYEVAPGILSGILTFFIFKPFRKRNMS